MYAALPPFSKKPRTACGSIAPAHETAVDPLVLRPAGDQLGLDAVGSVGSPCVGVVRSVKPTNAATAVPTPSIGMEPLGCSSM